MAIDAATARGLRLVAAPPHSPSLLSTLAHHARTDAGKLLLRANVLQPLTDAPTLAARAAAVAELAAAPAAAAALDAALRALPPTLDRMTGALALRVSIRARGTAKGVAEAARGVQLARLALRGARVVAAALKEGLEAPLLTAIATALDHPSLQALADALDTFIDEAAAAQLGRGGHAALAMAHAVAAAPDGLLTAARAALTAVGSAAAEEAGRVRGLPGLAAAKLTYTDAHGFTLTAPRAPANAPLPEGCVLVSGRRGGGRMLSTPALAALSARAAAAASDCLSLSGAALDSALDVATSSAPVLHRLVDAIALADLLASLAAAARRARGPVCVPRLTGAGPLVLTDIRCPLLEAAGATCVPNDACVGGAALLHVVTGPNSGGKTTHLRAIALNAIIACIGGLPLATFAGVPRLDRVCGRSGAAPADAARSAFAAECAELAATLATATPHTLVLLDEPGRATSTADGGGLAWAAAEALLQRGVRTLLATHHTALGGLAAYDGVKLWHMQAEVVEGERRGEEDGGGDRAPLTAAFLRPTWRLAPGACPVRHYGLALAPALGVPADVVADAAAVAARVEAASARSAAAQPLPHSTTAAAAAADVAHRAAALSRAGAAGAGAAGVAARLAELRGAARAALAALDDGPADEVVGAAA